MYVTEYKMELLDKGEMQGRNGWTSLGKLKLQRIDQSSGTKLLILAFSKRPEWNSTAKLEMSRSDARELARQILMITEDS